MKPRKFNFHSPSSMNEMWEMVEEYEDEFMFYAGGTEAIIGLKERVLDAEHLINVKQLPNLKEIKVDGETLRIGALVTHQELAESEVIQAVLPSYSRLSHNIANIRVRNAGTLAGNLCFAEPNADPPAMLAALGAQVELLSREQKRSVAISEFFDGPYSTVREEDELLSEIVIPIGKAEQFSVYNKIVYLNRPSAGVAVVHSPHATESEWEIWAGSLTGMPERMHQLCRYLNEGGEVDEPLLMEIAARDTQEWDVLEGVYGSTDYRKHLAAVLAVRGVLGSVGR